MKVADPFVGAAVLEVLDVFWQVNAYPPTCRALAAAAGCSCSTAHEWLGRLTEDGVIEMRAGHPIPKWVLARLTCGDSLLVVKDGKS